MKSVSMAATVLAPLIIYPYVTRVLGPAGIGKVNFAQSVVFYFTMIAQLGVPTYGIRECAKVRDDREALSKTVQEILLINAVTCLMAYLLFFVCLFTVPQMKSEKTLFAVMSFSVLLNVIGVEWLYNALEKYDYLAAITLGVKLLMIILAFLLVRSKENYVIYGAILVLGSIGWGVISFLNLGREIDLKPVGNYEIKRHLKPIGIFFAMSVATTVYTMMDSAMLGFMKGTLENGYYDSAVKVKMALVAAITALGTVLLPRSSYKLGQGDRLAFEEMSKKAMAFVISVGIPCCAYFMMFARPVIMLLSGAEFGNSVRPMQLIMPTVALIGITNITGIQMMIPLGREKGVLAAEIAGAVINLIVNAILIPRMGASGAAIGTVAAETVVLLFELWFVRDLLKIVFNRKAIIKTALATCAGAAASFWIMNKNYSSFLTLLLSFAVFIAVYGAVRLIPVIKAR